MSDPSEFVPEMRQASQISLLSASIIANDPMLGNTLVDLSESELMKSLRLAK
jgi:hypothetical protein